jgi:hypothetical protein
MNKQFASKSQKYKKKQKRHIVLFKTMVPSTMFLVLLERLDDTMLFVTLESSLGVGV